MHLRGEIGAKADAQEVIPPITDDLSIGGIDQQQLVQACGSPRLADTGFLF
jgi:hypothetical protein